MSTGGRRFVIIGDGAAGMTAAREVRRRDPAASVTLVSDDPQPAYFRAALTNYLLGELSEQHVWAVPPSFFGEYRIERLFARVHAVDAVNKHIHLEHGREPRAYDGLLIASGARARPPPFDGGHLPGVATMRTLQDARFILDRILLHGARRVVSVGGGALGIEWALAMRERGLVSTLVVREDHVMTGALDRTASDLTITRLRQLGVDVRMEDEVAVAEAGPDGSVAAVTTRSGQRLPCEISKRFAAATGPHNVYTLVGGHLLATTATDATGQPDPATARELTTMVLAAARDGGSAVPFDAASGTTGGKAPDPP